MVASDKKWVDDTTKWLSTEYALCTMTISDKKANEIKKPPQLSMTVLWREQQNGRLTISVFHDVHVRANPVSLVK